MADSGLATCTPIPIERSSRLQGQTGKKLRLTAYRLSIVPQSGIAENGAPFRFIPNPVGDANPLCSLLADPGKTSDAPIWSTLVREGRFISFSTTSGKKIKAQWQRVA